jgi:hypothetical protein
MRREVCDAIEAEQFTFKQGQRWFDNAGRAKAARRLTGQLWNCTDVVPSYICNLVEIPQGSTFAKLVRMIREEVPAA